MKLYTNTFDLAKASPHRFWVAPYSDFKIGIKILAKGEVLDKDFTVKAGAVELTPDADKIDGFTLYTLKSGDTGFVEYTIEVEDIAEKLKLTQIVTDSTVFEVGGGGGDVPADVATQSWVESQISDFITEDALTAYATKGELTAYAETSDLTAYAAKTDLTAYAEKTDLTSYYTKSETSSATEISTALEGKQPAGNYLTAETDPTFNAWLSGDSVNAGYGTQVGSRAIAIGYATKANGQYSVAIGGPNCTVGLNATYAIQLGSGSNNESNTFKVFKYQMLSSDGKIPNERLHLSAVSESDWATLSGSADAGTFYFVY